MQNNQKKRFGQVFLKDPRVIERTIEWAHVQSTDSVLEIGCGEGILSEACAKKANHLTIIEIDPHFLNKTQERLIAYPNVSYILADVLKTPFDGLAGSRLKVIANIPYYISAPIVKHFIQESAHIDFAVIMVQKEFAKKLIAKPGDSDYTSLTIFTQFHMTCQYAFSISRHSFYPVPKVDSAVIQLTPRANPLFTVNETLFFNIVRSAFWGRRKTLLKCLGDSPYLNLNPAFKSNPEFLARFAGLRGETLSIENFHEMYLQLAAYFV